jgi:colicin import membrane protein
MSHVLTYRDPNRLPAGLLALAVHAAFFSLLLFGMRWQAHPAEEFAVELWDTLPVMEVAPQQNVMPPVETTPAPEAKSALPQPAKADIELREKKVSKAEPEKPDEQELKAKRDAELKAQRDADEQRMLTEYAEKRRQTEQARVRAEVDAATAAEVGRYQDMIRSKIRLKIVMPPDVPKNAEVVFRVTLLPGGKVMDVVLLKSSGNTAYDDATERAIYKADTLPWPTDAEMQKLFRAFRLTMRPTADAEQFAVRAASKKPI